MNIDLIVRKNTGCKNVVKKARNILVIGVFHGDEEIGEFLINSYLKTAPNITAPNITVSDITAPNVTVSNVLKNNLYYIPRLNLNNKRTNINGVDLNRNFPTKNWELGEKNEYFGGTMAASEAEVKFVIELMNKVSFDAVITIHTPYKVVNFDGDKAGQAFKLAQKVSEFTGYPVESDIGYPTPGSFGTYAGVERDIPVITIEADEEIDPNELLPNFVKLFAYLENEY